MSRYQRETYFGDFHGCVVDFAAELLVARKAAGLTTTNLDDLHTAVSKLYLQCPLEMNVPYQSLLAELVRRMEFHGETHGGQAND